jgi:hypothetical protein
LRLRALLLLKSLLLSGSSLLLFVFWLNIPLHLFNGNECHVKILRFTTTTTTRKPGTFSDSFFSFIRQKKKYTCILRCNLQATVHYSAQCDGSDRYVFFCTIRRPNRCRSRGDEISSNIYLILIDNIACMSVIDNYDIYLHYRLRQSYP